MNKNYIQRDAVLDTFVYIINENDIEMGLTLFVGGLIVTGDLISFKKYLEGIGESFQESESEVAKSIGEVISSIIPEKTEDKESEEGQDSSDVNFIHLQNVTVISSNTNYSVPFWRGSLASVDGFSFGKFNFNN